MARVANPFRPGAGHPPPHLAGRKAEVAQFERLLEQDIILENAVLTGLRGVGKTVLLDSLKPLAIERGWLWAGSDLDEAAGLGEDTLAVRLRADLAAVVSSVEVARERIQDVGFAAGERTEPRFLDYNLLTALYERTPGLALDKLKAVLEAAWRSVARARPGARGVVFAYDEAHNLADRPDKERFPLALLLDAFQSLQRSGLPLMLALAGLPALFPKLSESRAFAERMFRVVRLETLSEHECREAIARPLEALADERLRFDAETVDTIARMSGGYPYFVQFFCREAFDAMVQGADRGGPFHMPAAEIERKLDADFFAGRWARLTDRQRQLLEAIARPEDPDAEFTLADAVERSRVLEKPFGASHVHQILSSLGDRGLIYKDRRGRYRFALPLLGRFVLRQRGAA